MRIYTRVYLSVCVLTRVRVCRVRICDSAVLSVRNCRVRFCPVTVYGSMKKAHTIPHRQNRSYLIVL
jgi:hypothetical protein